MRNKDLKVAFVASALPISYFLEVKDNSVTDIECTPTIYSSFQAANLSGTGIKVNQIPSGLLRSLIYFINIIRNAREVIIFHECCWVILDLILVFSKAKVTYQPMVSLKGFQALSDAENGVQSWYSYQNKRGDFFNIFQLLVKLTLRNWFDYYKCTDDGGIDSIRIAVLKPQFKTQWECRDPYLQRNSGRLQLPNAPITNLTTSSKSSFLILCATEPTPDSDQIQIYNNIINILAKHNSTIHFKDHPRPQSRLKFSSTIAIEIDPNIPSQLFDFKYDFVIGAFSSSLVTVNGKCGTISIAKLLNITEKVFTERINHLMALDGFDKIHFINNPSEIESFISYKSKPIQN